MTEPIIKLSRAAQLNLTAWAFATGGREFSGLGTIRKDGNVFHVEDVFLLGVGSEVYTEFSPERQRSLPKEGLKLWVHRHPLGNGKPGPHNWSGTDENTATREPLGAPPELVQWSVAIVLTPGGWVGRVDIHTPKLRTFHCAVEPRVPGKEIVEECRQLLTPGLNQYIGVLLNEYEAMRARRFPAVPIRRTYSQYENDGWNQDTFDWYEDLEQENLSGLLSPCCAAEMDGIDEGEICDVTVTAFTCPNCGEIYVQISSEHPEVVERYAPAAPGPSGRDGRRIKSRRDWRRSFDNVFGRNRKR